MVSSREFNKGYFTSGAYKNYRGILAEWVKPVARRIYKILKKNPSAKVLDVGCGFGDLIAELKDNYSFSVEGVEYSSYAIKKSHPSVKGKIKKGNILRLPFRKNSFDAVVCFDVIYYLNPEEIKIAIKNLVNVSRKYILFNSIYRHSLEASQKINPDPLRITVLSKKEYIDIFSKNGARLVKNFREDNGGETLVFEKNK